MKMNSRSPQSSPDADPTTVKVYRFQCGHEQCTTQVHASTMDGLRLLIAQHLKETHSVPNVTDTLVSYLESTCVTVLPS